ncbi:cellulase family glycosylhydrolase [Hymenobacter sp. DH14]|uniref:Cellulase family glycosylhydrolase n=1 Tax=Hymenobacter cyanobacteriorum TaxID=2926463 RepID=A0A9X2AH30_9BACT|nr:cellulase family glycosylhydrolase [Hymenobacter cyanobacteriorum]MCI1186985.1 cellulase family glycosylhydrolase [Hymenobacter cyanobacteriorum]
MYFRPPFCPPPTGWNARFCNWLLLLALLLSPAGAVRAQSFLHAAGPKIVNANNQEVLLNGVNLGGWHLQEGYIIKPGWAGVNGKQTQGAVKQTLYAAGMTDAAVEAFYQSYRNNFITKPDIDFLAAQGFNCVRLPLHYDLFLTPAQRAVRNDVLHGTVTYPTYVSSLNDWYNANQLFTDPANLEAFRLIDNVLTWCAANNMYVILDLHAAPGSQGTDVNIADALRPLDLWNQPIHQDVTVRLWEKLAARYKNDARVAMYDLLNEPNNVPSNQPIHDLFERLINAVRAQGDNHLLLLEGNGYGNDFNNLTKNTFTNQANLVYNSHRYSGTGYLLDNNVGTTDAGSPNNLRTIGNLTRFRTTWNVPIWVGETGENTTTWMHDAAQSLNSVGIGWCHWTYKRFENGTNAALFHIPSPYIVDGPAGLPQVLTNILFGNAVANPAFAALAPNQNNIVNYPDGGSYQGLTVAPANRVVWLKGSNQKFVSSEGGYQAMTCTRAAYGAWEQFAVEAAGNGKVTLRNSLTNQFVSSENGTQAMTCTRATAGTTEQFEWLINPDGTISLRGNNGAYVSSENGTQAMTCTRTTLATSEKFVFGVVGSTALASGKAKAQPAGFYPNPVINTLTYEVPSSLKAHRLTVVDTTGRQVLAQSFEAVGEQHTVDISALKTGLYVVRIAGANFNSEFKISKQ